MGQALDARIDALADRQHCVITRGQLLDLGLSPGAVHRRLKSGRLRPLHRGVYQVGPVRAPRTTSMAAVLAMGPDGFASHVTAAWTWGLLLGTEPPVPVDVTFVGSSGRLPRPGIRVHRAISLGEDERALVDGVPATSVGRTLADLAGMVGRRDLELAFARAEREGLIGGGGLRSLADRYRGRPGASMLRMLTRVEGDAAFTRSEAEREFADLVREARLPRALVNARVGPYELDHYWPDEGIAVEIDGRSHHSSRPRFEGDRRKDAWLMARGIRVIRLSWSQITRDRTATAVELGQALALARQSGTRSPRGPSRT